MSNIFLNNELNSIFETVSESNISLPQWVTIVDKANATNTKESVTNNNVSATSSALVGQNGGSNSVTSVNSTRDVNKLISMLTSESSSANFKGLSVTSTASLEDQLREILKQDGGAKKYNKNKKSQKGGSNYNVDDIKSFFTNLKNTGVNVDIKLNNKTFSEFFGAQSEQPGQNEEPAIIGQNDEAGLYVTKNLVSDLLDATTTEISHNMSATSDNNLTNINNLTLSDTSAEPQQQEPQLDNLQIGGASKKKV